MSTIPVSFPIGGAVQGVAAGGSRCSNCGFADQGHYCSLCGDPLHAASDSVPRMLWDDLVARPVHDLFALLKTTWMILLRPTRFFRAVLVECEPLAAEPFPLAPAWKHLSHKPHGVLNAVKYFVVIWTFGVLASWIAHKEILPDVAEIVHLEGAEHLNEMVTLVLAASFVGLYARLLALLLGLRVPGKTLTKFLLYLQGLCLLLVLALGLLPDDSLWTALACVGLLIHAAVVLPYVVLPRLFHVSRIHLFLAEAGAFFLTVLALLVMLMAAAASYAWIGRTVSGGADDPPAIVTAPPSAEPSAPILPDDGSGGGASARVEDPDNIKVIQSLTQ